MSRELDFLGTVHSLYARQLLSVMNRKTPFVQRLFMGSLIVGHLGKNPSVDIAVPLTEFPENFVLKPVFKMQMSHKFLFSILIVNSQTFVLTSNE